jgi:ATP-dependent DNA helicase RecG
LDILRQRISEGKCSPHLGTISTLEQQMDALGLVGTLDGRRVLNHAALILLGRNEILKERISAHSAQFQVFAPDGSLPINLISGDPGLPHFCLLYLAVRIEELLRGVVPRREMMSGLFRVDIPAYGDDAMREAVMNAFIHRDYTLPEPVIIQITPHQCTITNPGGFYRDVSPENILFHEPCPRNQCLAHTCVHLNLMERSGRGVDRIFWDQIRFLRPLPSYGDSTPETVRLNLLGAEKSGSHPFFSFR